MVRLCGVDVGTVGVTLQNVAGRIRENKRLSLTLVDFEIGVQESPNVEVGQKFPFRRTHHHQVPPCRNLSACRDLKFVRVGRVV